VKAAVLFPLEVAVAALTLVACAESDFLRHRARAAVAEAAAAAAAVVFSLAIKFKKKRILIHSLRLLAHQCGMFPIHVGIRL